MKLSEAKKLAILKWKLIVKNDGQNSDWIKNNPKLKDLKANCGFCAYSYIKAKKEAEKKGDIYFNYCLKCPLYHETDKTMCAEDRALYLQWYNADGYEKLKLAEEMLELINSIDLRKYVHL